MGEIVDGSTGVQGSSRHPARGHEGAQAEAIEPSSLRLLSADDGQQAPATDGRASSARRTPSSLCVGASGP